MRIDLHTHSSVSDGTDSPAELVAKAAAAGLDVMALTDHDTAAGWAEAVTAAARHGVELVRGMEISTAHENRSVHLLAYFLDPTHPALHAELDRILRGRDSRVPGICERLVAVGIEIDEDDVRRAAGGAVAAGRPHVADALVAKGVVADRTEAFERFLKPGRPGYVHRYATPLVDMVGVVRAAGGVTVLAHPWGRGSRGVLDAEKLAMLRESGLDGIEVDHEDHDDVDRARLRAVAQDLDLVVTGSSDHHGLGKVGHHLGVNTTAPEEYERLLARRRTAQQDLSAGPSTG